jgi:hypothetical protein
VECVLLLWPLQGWRHSSRLRARGPARRGSSAVAAGRGRGKGRAPGGCLGAKRRRRTWHAATSPGEPRAGFDPGISEWGNPPALARVPPPESIGRRGEPGELKHLSTRRKGHQQNPPALGPGGETPSVAASERGPGQRPRGANRNRLERRARAGDSPVRARASLRSSSRAGHVEPCPNAGGPPSKPKYSLATDSEPVP